MTRPEDAAPSAPELPDEPDVAAELARLSRAVEAAAEGVRGSAEADPALRTLGQGPLQQLLSSAVRLYAACRERDGGVEPFDASSGTPSATEVLLTVSALLEAVNVEPFELGLWQMWGTRGGRGGAD